MRGAGLPGQVLYSKQMAASVPETLILSYRAHPLRPKLLEELATAPRDVLRWEFVTRTSIKSLPKNIQRTALKGKWETAFRAALLRNGYGTDGSNLNPTVPRQGLVGRLEIMITQAQGMESASEELVSKCNQLVTALEGHSPHGRGKSSGGVIRRIGGSTP